MTAVAERMTFMAVHGSRISDEEAARCGPELLRLYQEEGMALVAPNVVAAARKRSSPLHASFTWDDGIAAVQWREREARDLLNGIAFVMETGEENDPEPMHFFLAVTVATNGDGEVRYMPRPTIETTPELHNDLLRRALAELKAFQGKYATLKRLAQIVNWAALQSAINEVSR